MDFNADLHKILLESETQMYKERNELKFFVFVRFNDLQEFTDCLDYSNFDEGGVTSFLKDDCLAVELQDLFEYNGYRLKDYKHCFNNDDFKRYEKEILEFDGEAD